jgi:hypothetical protein
MGKRRPFPQNLTEYAPPPIKARVEIIPPNLAENSLDFDVNGCYPQRERNNHRFQNPDMNKEEPLLFTLLLSL